MTDPADRVAVIHDYFRRADAGSATLLDLFTEDAQIYFPRYGIGQGREVLLDIMAGLGRVMTSARHDSATFLFIRQGEHVVVEGTTSGTLVGGGTWSAGETPAGRFCNVFVFRGDKIARLHIYLDPDYAGEDKAGFHWGREGRSW